MKQNYFKIVEHYEECLEKHGDTHLGVDWPNANDAATRYQVMLELIKEAKDVSLLDFGCGTSHLYEFMIQNQMTSIQYSGLDISEKFIQLAREKFPKTRYYCCDILGDNTVLPIFDYVVFNGVFTEKRNLSFDEMFKYLQSVLLAIQPFVKSGFAFNVMSQIVDWERNDLFHLSFDTLASFLSRDISRNFLLRHDYRLYEYTVYVYK